MAFDPEKITYFAKTDARGQNMPFGIKAKDRQRHVYVIGKTGMGKSTMLENMAVQDIQNGEGLAFIDPHGQTAETLLDFIPESRVKDVLYFAPFDMEHPVSFNIMEDVGPDKRHLVVSGLMAVFEKIWVDAWSARMAYILQNTLMALLEYPGSTLLGVNNMLSDPIYREKVVANVTDPGVKSFWVNEFANYNERYMQEAGDAIKNKTGQFSTNPVIRNIIGQPKSSFDIREIMDNKKILIMNLSKGLIGESNANLLGSMLTTKIYLAAMSRADMSQEAMREMPNFYFYVDEFQSFANATFANILSEARKYKLNLTIAHQYIEQMEEDVRNAVFGNVGTTVAFRVGPFDAEVLETIFSPQFLAPDIVNLGFAQVYMTLMIDGIGSQPFSATTLPPIEKQPISYKDVVIAASRKQFARPRAEVEAAVMAFHDSLQKEAEEARRNKKMEKNKKRETSAPRENMPRTAVPTEEHREERRPERPVERQEERHEVRSEEPREHRAPHTGSRLEALREAPRPRTETRPRDDTRHKSAEELRSVLRTIVSQDKDAKPAEKPVQKKTGSDEARAELQAVLKTVIKEPTAATPEVRQEEVDTRAEPQQGNYGSDISAKADVPADGISAKELERMMRITTSDKPPIK